MSVDTAVYGTQRCPLTQGIREWLGEHRVPYDFYDIENDAEAEERVRRMNDGQLKYPMVTVGDRGEGEPDGVRVRLFPTRPAGQHARRGAARRNSQLLANQRCALPGPRLQHLRTLLAGVALWQSEGATADEVTQLGRLGSEPHEY